MDKSNLLTWAERYIKQGFSVIPINPKTKHPTIETWLEFQSRYPTGEELKTWFEKKRYPGIAIVTGALSQVCVIDVDSHKHPEAIEKIKIYLPDDDSYPIARSQHGGWHLYFKCNGDLKGNQNIPFDGIDLRANGNCCIAPPTPGYTWKRDIALDRSNLLNLTNSYLSYLSLNIKSTVQSSILGTRASSMPSDERLLQPAIIRLTEGSRDESLFHIAHTMIKGGATPQDTEIVLNIIAENCKPPFPKSEIQAKIKSCLERAKRKERNLAKEVECYISVTSGHFSVTSCYMALQVVTKEDKGAVRIAINRLLKQGVIEKYGDRDGEYRRIETEFELIEFDKDDPEETPYLINLPFGLSDLVEISEGNIILVGGEFNSGKTTFMLNVLFRNKDRLPIRYLSSEMNKSEFKKRFRGFGLPMECWVQNERCIYLKRSSDFASALDPDALNIIDYLEFKDSDYTRGAEIMTGIHDKLKKGVALVAVQKKEGVRLPRSSDMVLEKPRLGITLTKEKGELETGIAEIIKAKNVKIGKCDGKRLRYEIINFGSHFRVLNEWGFWRT